MIRSRVRAPIVGTSQQLFDMTQIARPAPRPRVVQANEEHLPRDGSSYRQFLAGQSLFSTRVQIAPLLPEQFLPADGRAIVSRNGFGLSALPPRATVGQSIGPDISIIDGSSQSNQPPRTIAPRWPRRAIVVYAEERLPADGYALTLHMKLEVSHPGPTVIARAEEAMPAAGSGYYSHAAALNQRVTNRSIVARNTDDSPLDPGRSFVLVGHPAVQKLVGQIVSAPLFRMPDDGLALTSHGCPPRDTPPPRYPIQLPEVLPEEGKSVTFRATFGTMPLPSRKPLVSASSDQRLPDDGLAVISYGSNQIAFVPQVWRQVVIGEQRPGSTPWLDLVSSYVSHGLPDDAPVAAIGVVVLFSGPGSAALTILCTDCTDCECE